MAGARFWSSDFTSGFVANAVNRVATLNANDHVRHVRVNGNATFTPYPTAVLGDNGIWLGFLATFPAAAPVVPSFANSGTWQSGYWNRAAVDAVELAYMTGPANPPSVRYFWHLDFDYAVDGGVAGGLYLGHQVIYVDANHALPDVSYSMTAWGFST
jgi:hypothetical protein